MGGRSIAIILAALLSPLPLFSQEKNVDPFTSNEAENDSVSLFEVVPDPEGNAYFPEGREHWYTDHLRAMKEPSLFALEGKKNAPVQYRFLYLPTFSKPIVFRTIISKREPSIRIVRLNGMGGYDPGKIELEAEIEISKLEYMALKEALDRALEEPVSELQKAALAGLDGSQWILESLVNGEYKMQDLWSPDYYLEIDVDHERFEKNFGVKFPDLHSFVRGCNYFLELTDMRFPDRDPNGIRDVNFQGDLPVEISNTPDEN